MKKFVFLITIATLSGCTDEFSDCEDLGNDIIQFRMMSEDSRASAVTTMNIKERYPDMDVVAFGCDTTGMDRSADEEPYFKTCLHLATMTTDTAYYWPLTSARTPLSLDFFVTPKAVDQYISNVSYNGSNMQFTYTAPATDGENDAVHSPDLVFAHTKASGGTVPLHFRHALASVKVVYKNVAVGHRIGSVTLHNVPTQADCLFSDNSFTWTNVSDRKNLIQKTNASVFQDNTSLSTGEMVFMVIPGETISLSVDIDGKTLSKVSDHILTAGETMIIYIDDNIQFASTDAVVTSKTMTENADGTYDMLLEAYVTGSVRVKTEAVPTNSVLVVDCSGSMSEVLRDSPVIFTKPRGSTDLSGLDTSKPSCYYGISYNGTFDDEAPVRYHSGDWQYRHPLYGWVKIENWLKYYNCTFYRTKLGAMIDACTNYINTLATDAGEHQISIVCFPGESGDTHTSKALCTKINAHTGKATLLSAVNSMFADGATPSDKGMQTAVTLMEDPNDFTNIVTLITDGDPNHDSGFDGDVADAAIQAAYTCKSEYEAQVFTLGLFDDGEASSNGIAYMDRVSSDYPDATTYKNGTKTSSDYYTLATSESLMHIVMESISRTVIEGYAAINLGTETQIVNKLSGAFLVPDDGQITLSECQWLGNGAWGEEQPTDATYTRDASTITIQGFDFSKHFCGEEAPDGRKLVIHIRNLRLLYGITLDNVRVNDNGTGIYNSDGVLISNIPASGT